MTAGTAIAALRERVITAVSMGHHMHMGAAMAVTLGLPLMEAYAPKHSEVPLFALLGKLHGMVLTFIMDVIMQTPEMSATLI